MARKGFLIKEVNRDKRGAIWVIEQDGKEKGMVVYTKAGFLRGGHSHNGKELHFLISGKLLEKTPKKKVLLKKYGDVCINPPNVPHMLKSVTDSVFLEIKPNAKTTSYDKWRKLVVEKMK